MSEEAQAPTAPAEGPLSVDQAIASLLAPPEQEQAAPEAPVEVAEEPTQSEAEPTADEQASEPETANASEHEEAQPEPETPAIEPPRFWDADAKARFRELSPEHQAIVLAQAEKGVQASAKAIQEASERAKQAEQAAAGIQARIDKLDALLPRAEETFKSRWEGIDWLALSREDPGEFVAYKAQYDAEIAQLQGLQAAKQEADAERRAAFIRSETEALATEAPDLVDPVKGEANRKELFTFLKTKGVSDDDFAGLSAFAAGLAYDGMRFRQLKAKPLTPAKPAVQPARVVKPTSVPSQSPQQRTVLGAQNRFNAKPSQENAIALLLAKKA